MPCLPIRSEKRKPTVPAPCNILFVLYSDFTCNSASHVHSLVQELAALGHSCAVAVPFGKETSRQFGFSGFQALLFDEAETLLLTFPDGRGPDIVHAWTPREIVRKFCLRIANIYKFRLFVHMEDNEWHILARFTGLPWEQLAGLSVERLDAIVPEGLSHPTRGVRFMEKCAGITVIVDRLSELVPPHVPTRVLWPSAQRDIFFPRPLPKLDGGKLGIPPENTVIVYTGNVHAANAHDVRSLYLAAAMLNREGFPVTLVRTGRDFCDFLGADDRWARRHSVELGLVSRWEIPCVMALADVFVQPGRAGPFNDYRFPSKLPEFLSIGRPVILPEANIARGMTHGEHAWVLANADAVNICEAVRIVMGDADLYRRLAAGAVAFFEEHLDWTRGARSLSAFYSEAIANDKQYDPSASYSR
jgi:glycosyltransferase involved in cell wall biosynthesis